MPLSPLGQPVLGSYTLDPQRAREYLEARAQPPYGLDQDSLQLERYEAHWRGEQYAHQGTDWWGMSADDYETISPASTLPRGFTMPANSILTSRQKRPSIETGACATIVEGYTDLMYSEQAAPEVTVEGDPQTESFLHALFEKMGWLQKWSYARDLGGAVGTVVVLLAAREGRMDMEVVNRRFAIPLWKNRRALQLGALLIWRKTMMEVDAVDDKGQPTKRLAEVVHRRIVTEMEDVTYRPIRMDDTRTWAWEPVPELSVQHKLGFFPGVWVQNTAADDEPDGLPDCEGAWKQVDALDRLMSQTNKGELATVDPTVVISDDPKAKEAGSVRTGSDNTLEVSDKGKVDLLEPAATGLASAMSFCDRLEQWISRRTGYVFLDPKEAGAAAASSLAIRLMFRPMIQRADKKRSQYGRAMKDAAALVIRIVQKFSGRVALPPGPNGEERVGVFTWDVDPARDQDGLPVPQQLGTGGILELKWGPYFNSSPAEDLIKVQVATAAKTTGLIDARTAAASVAGEVFQVRDVDAMLKKATSEQEADTDRLLAQASAGLGQPRQLTGAAASDVAGARREGAGGQPAGDTDAR